MAFVVNTTIVVPNSNLCYGGSAFASPVYIGTCVGLAAPNSASDNIIIGGQTAGFITTAGTSNIIIAALAANNTTQLGNCNIILGPNYNCFNTGNGNIAIGPFALNKICGHDNTAIGMYAAFLVGSASCNIAIGAHAMYSMACSAITTGCANVAIGICTGTGLVTSASLHNFIGACYSAAALGGFNGTTWIGTSGLTAPYMIVNPSGIGINVTCPFASLHISGALYATSEITAYYSDRRLKENITAIPDAIDKIKQINGVSYIVNKKAISYGFEENKKQVGVIADEVEKVLPEVVVPAPFDVAGGRGSVSGENYKTVKYEKLVPLLVEGIKELKIKADSIRDKINTYKQNIHKS